ncbi:MAG: chromosomal replication initiator protein DnaA [Gammaproteobacteria bacterium]|nr:MAG: chromosomal replication initiator protein DnaA [Gammaproteobacteria bacterium]
MSKDLWGACLNELESKISSQQFYTWIKPLQAEESEEALQLLAPNRFVLDWVRDNFISQIEEIVSKESGGNKPIVVLKIGSKKTITAAPIERTEIGRKRPPKTGTPKPHSNNINPSLTFDTFVVGKSNQLAEAASRQVSENPLNSYNPLFIYGATGLGKTHLMHSIGNSILEKNPGSTIVYLSSERFVSDMVKALQHKRMDQFKQFYRSVDALFVDDIQFFAGKERSQEEFFYTFNSLIENKSQIVLTCDRYPKEISGLDERLKSRFGWGLPVSVEPPDLETRVAILMNKALNAGYDLPQEVAFFIGKRIRSNVRELEGALRRVIAHAHFTKKPITLDFAREALRDLISLQDRLTTIENIQKSVAEYFKIKISDLHSKKRTRSITRPRQIAMALSKELTNHSLPEIGKAFGDRDHTTVLHACKKVKELIESDLNFAEDYTNLLRTLSH